MQRHEQRLMRRNRRRRGLRARLRGEPDRPRLSVYRSNQHIYAQVIDDLSGRTLAAASTAGKDAKVQPGNNCTAAAAVGKLIGERAAGAGITQVVFDRNGYRYHGRVRALADAAREAGLKF